MSSSSPELLHIPYSPWSERARWALEARRVPHRARVYQPLLGEPELRFRLRRWRGPVTVPVLLVPGAEAIADSYDIARWAAGRGEGPDLFPVGADPDIERWNALSERALAAGRVLSLRRSLQDPAALAELIPKKLRAALGRVGPMIASQGVRRTLHKYAHVLGQDEPGAALRGVLDELRRALGPTPIGPDGAPRHLLPEAGFSYADITAAQALAFVTPPATGLRIGRANRQAFTDADIAPAYADLLAWRDALYARFRQA